MSDNEATSRRQYLRATAGAATVGLVGLAGCSGGTATGTLATRVTDQPGDIADFESCVVTIAGIWVKPGTESDTETDSTADQSDEREYHEFDEPQTADLVELQDGNTALVDERELETGEYAFLQLDVTGIDATLDDGSDATVDTPGEAPLQFQTAFEIREATQTVFTADFTPVKRGQTGTYVLQPVASGTQVEYETEGGTQTDA
jgi:hypothetical protein